MTEYNDTPTSKTRRKQHHKDLTQAGLDLMGLKTFELERLPLTRALQQGLDEARRIHDQEARRRHAVFLARLVADADTESLLSALAALRDPLRQQRLQRWLEKLLQCDAPGDTEPVLQQILDTYPHGDRQTLRNRTRNLLKVRPDPDRATPQDRDRFRRARKQFLALLNDLERRAPLY